MARAASQWERWHQACACTPAPKPAGVLHQSRQPVASFVAVFFAGTTRAHFLQRFQQQAHKRLRFALRSGIIQTRCCAVLKCATQVFLAGVAKLADAYGSGPYEGNFMKVQVLSPAPLLLAPLVSFLRIVPRIAYAWK